MNTNLSSLSDYYKSPTWAAKRNERLKIDGFKCAKCGFTRALEVHHINYERVFHEDVSRDLITLCKKCHKEIEGQKNKINPVREITENHSVYFAGKISHNGWRIGWGELVCEQAEKIEDLAKYEYQINDELTYTGPIFLSCDHGCYHGPGTHGVGADGLGCGGLPTICMEDVLYICKSQIERAEILFAYIDSADCFGTIAEIGFAHAIGKDIFIVFSNKELKEEMWFVDQMQRNTGIASSKWLENNLLSKIKEGKR